VNKVGNLARACKITALGCVCLTFEPRGVAHGDPEHETVTWAVAHQGDQATFRAAEATYTTSPERARVFETFPACIAEHEIGFVQSAV